MAPVVLVNKLFPVVAGGLVVVAGVVVAGLPPNKFPVVFVAVVAGGWLFVVAVGLVAVVVVP